jgi:uncharacterized Zn finger protein
VAKQKQQWWSQQFLDALESCTDRGRLSRGRGYAGPSRMLSCKIEGHRVHTVMRGRVNPYFGVHKEPRYQVSFGLKKIPQASWKTILKQISQNAGWLSRLLLGEVPEDIERAFEKSACSLLPRHKKELISQCSCPDPANPCKHVAGTCYHIADQLNHDPFLLFQLRGLSQAALHTELVKFPLGKALSANLQQDADLSPEVMTCRYPPAPPTCAPESMTTKAFWQGQHLPDEADKTGETDLPALIIRREGDAPAFWNRDNSFIEAISEIYRQVPLKNPEFK